MQTHERPPTMSYRQSAALNYSAQYKYPPPAPTQEPDF